MLPKYIKATKSVTYEVEFALFMAKERDIDTSKWTTADVIAILEEEIIEDFGYEDPPTFEELNELDS